MCTTRSPAECLSPPSEAPAWREWASALDSKFRNHRFYLITSDQTPLTFFIGKSSVSGVFHPASRDGQRTAESRTKSRTQPVFDERTPTRGRAQASISKIACWKFVRSHNLTLLVENFETATIYSTVPSCIANCSRFVFVPERAVREAFALKIPSVMRLARSDFVLIHVQRGVSLADKILQYQEGFPLASVERM